MSPYADKVKQAAKVKAYYLEHKEAIRAQGKARYQANRESILAQTKAYRETHKEEIAAQLKAKFAANPEIRRQEGRRYYAKNREVILSNFKKRQYGLNAEQMRALLASQGGVCKVCGKDDWGPRGPMVDHDHRPGGRVRGILCHYCNTAIGLIKEDPAIAQSIIKYLKGGEL
jgi:hypothetical protein